MLTDTLLWPNMKGVLSMQCVTTDYLWLSLWIGKNYCDFSLDPISLEAQGYVHPMDRKLRAHLVPYVHAVS